MEKLTERKTWIRRFVRLRVPVAVCKSLCKIIQLLYPVHRFSAFSSKILVIISAIFKLTFPKRDN